jgi:hypothetical protein
LYPHLASLSQVESLSLTANQPMKERLETKSFSTNLPLGSKLIPYLAASVLTSLRRYPLHPLPTMQVNLIGINLNPNQLFRHSTELKPASIMQET